MLYPGGSRVVEETVAVTVGEPRDAPEIPISVPQFPHQFREGVFSLTAHHEIGPLLQRLFREKGDVGPAHDHRDIAVLLYLLQDGEGLRDGDGYGGDPHQVRFQYLAPVEFSQLLEIYNRPYPQLPLQHGAKQGKAQAGQFELGIYVYSRSLRLDQRNLHISSFLKMQQFEQYIVLLYIPPSPASYNMAIVKKLP